MVSYYCARPKEQVKFLNDYFAGTQTYKNIEPYLSIKTTEFRKTIYEFLCSTGYYELLSYKTIADKTGHYGAYRAVGTAMKDNIYPIFIPCHRVIKSNGELGDYSSGPVIKRLLIDYEKNFIR